MSDYRREHGLDDRIKESGRVMRKYPDRVPIIVEAAKGSKLPSLDKKKYLAPIDITMGQFAYVVRRRLAISPEQAIFIFANNVLPPTGAMMSTIYEEFKDPDGFLYLTYTGENTFGKPNL